MTALFYAVSQGDTRIVNLLLANGAKRTVEGHDVFEYAKEYRKSLDSELVNSYPIIKEARIREYNEMMRAISTGFAKLFY